MRVVVATDGIAGDPEQRYDGQDYAQLRRQESQKAMACLAVDDLQFWGLPDSCLLVEADLVRVGMLAAEQIRSFKPDIIYLPWSGDGNSDHLALHDGVMRGMRSEDFAGQALGYEVWSPIPRPEMVVDISSVVPAKRRAIACYESQLAYVDLPHLVFGLNSYRCLLLERSGAFGEAFAHVMPEKQRGV